MSMSNAYSIKVYPWSCPCIWTMPLCKPIKFVPAGGPIKKLLYPKREGSPKCGSTFTKAGPRVPIGAYRLAMSTTCIPADIWSIANPNNIPNILKKYFYIKNTSKTIFFTEINKPSCENWILNNFFGLTEKYWRQHSYRLALYIEILWNSSWTGEEILNYKIPSRIQDYLSNVKILFPFDH